MKLTGENRSTRRETCPSATLSTTNPTWTDLGSNPGLRCGTVDVLFNTVQFLQALQLSKMNISSQCLTTTKKQVYALHATALTVYHSTRRHIPED
jgi:hypothetical protein